MEWVCPACGNDYREVGVSNTEVVYYTYNEEGGVFEIRRTEYVDDTPIYCGHCGSEIDWDVVNKMDFQEFPPKYLLNKWKREEVDK